ncbi:MULTISPECIES: hypothetical protein [Bacillus cereus group]|uniref:hypothetical protein n=1 Tax=Bacillus cereus group TaxID=86661 RepID=UPI0008640CF1|nr:MULTISPECIES: hypothetical protein [Bacillus cereus group]AWC28767.1 hypothetical protein CG483_010605 [Bacillus cytotoxicus]AWC39850.1 hypothetical protein CG480_004650 [Bacillus cytotoxicus]AWC47781.1 hypothetical protein CG478_004650 [Bacillus cytotoxicus]AWC52834.1 hypothetical protein CG477_010560 [Bacillus cytotoxicus]AWC56966.1 hypothetical protein CG476_010590 [Bacillus cytotoxicus]
MLQALLVFSALSFLFILGGFILLLQQQKEIQNIKTMLNEKQNTTNNASGNGTPVKLDMNVLNSLLSASLSKDLNVTSNHKEESKE